MHRDRQREVKTRERKLSQQGKGTSPAAGTARVSEMGAQHSDSAMSCNARTEVKSINLLPQREALRDHILMKL